MKPLLFTVINAGSKPKLKFKHQSENMQFIPEKNSSMVLTTK